MNELTNEIIILLRAGRQAGYQSDIERANRNRIREIIDSHSYDEIVAVHKEILELFPHRHPENYLSQDFANYRGMHSNNNLYPAY